MTPKILIVLGLVFLAACSSDKPSPTAEVTAEDSVLAHDVLAAWGDSVKPIVEERVADLDDFSSGVTGGSSTRTVPKPVLKVVQPTTSKQVVATPGPLPTAVAVAPAPAPTEVASASPSPPEPKEPTESAEPREKEKEKEKVEHSRVGTLSRGATLSVVTTQSVCSNQVGVGDTFRAVLVAPVSGSNGLVIPAGASATGEVTSLSEWGAGIGVRITSVHYDGREYSLRSHVAYVVPESSANGACIPRRTHLETEI